jgi:hypothetical protein
MSDVIRFHGRVNNKRPRAPIPHPTSEDRKRRHGGGAPWAWLVQRKCEIERCAQHLSAYLIDEIIDGEIVRRYFEQFLIAWAAHNRKSKDPVGDLMAAAVRMGGPITKAEARAALDQAEDMPHAWKADDIAHYLGIFFADRKELGLKTIGSVDVGKGARKVLRQREDRMYQQRKRRARGAKPLAQYEAEALSNTRPWERHGISRAQWYRRGKPSDETSASAVNDETSASAVPPKGGVTKDGPVSSGRPQEAIRGGADGTVGANTEDFVPTVIVIRSSADLRR